MKLVKTIPLPDEAHLIEWLDDLIEQREVERLWPPEKYYIDTNLETRTILIYEKDPDQWPEPLIPPSVSRFFSALKKIVLGIK